MDTQFHKQQNLQKERDVKLRPILLLLSPLLPPPMLLELSPKPFLHMSHMVPLLNTRELKLFPVQCLKVNLLLLLLMQSLMVMVTPTGAERNVPPKPKLNLRLMPLLKLIMVITVTLNTTVDTADTMVDTTDIPMDMDTVMDGANKQ